MKIGIFSDTHDRIDYIDKAVTIFNNKAVDYVIHCGDIISPFAAAFLNNLNCEYIGVFGNNDGDWLMINKFTNNRFFKPPKEIELNNKKIVIFHEPFIIDYIDKNVDFVIYGHTHKKDLKQKNHQLVLNPGAASGYLSDESTICILDIESRSVNFIGL